VVVVWWWCGGGVVVVWWWCGGGVVVVWRAELEGVDGAHVGPGESGEDDGLDFLDKYLEVG
jgi:hypothetical protein